MATSSSKPSDSFPGLAALVTGGSPKSTGLYYDVAYDRSLDPPAATTGTGLAAGSCYPFTVPTGTTTDNDQGIEYDDTKLNGGVPGAALTEGGIASIDPKKLVRNPLTGCAPVYPYRILSGQTLFSAWSIRREDTRRGLTSTRRILSSRGREAEGWTITTRRKWIRRCGASRRQHIRGCSVLSYSRYGGQPFVLDK